MIRTPEPSIARRDAAQGLASRIREVDAPRRESRFTEKELRRRLHGILDRCTLMDQPFQWVAGDLPRDILCSKETQAPEAQASLRDLRPTREDGAVKVGIAVMLSRVIKIIACGSLRALHRR
ncbi:MAG: hypothetical protein JWO36_5985 [Myxococcales bacterium]|nr:hypothetical protein [Myxococcales bacterium]